MGQDYDRPDDSNAPRHDRNSVAEETSAAGQRIKGAVKKETGELINDSEMAEEGSGENEAGNDRQRRNDAM